MGLVNETNLYPAEGDADLDWDRMEPVSAETLERFAGMAVPGRAIAKSLKRDGQDGVKVRSRNGTLYYVPVK